MVYDSILGNQLLAQSLSLMVTSWPMDGKTYSTYSTYDVMFCDQLLADRTAQAERAVQTAVDAKNEVRNIKNTLYI